MIMDGKFVSEKWINELKEEISLLEKKPSFCVIRIGEDPASAIYVRNKHKKCDELGILFTEYHLEEKITQEELEALIFKLNHDDQVHGIMLQSPIPKHLDIMKAFSSISPKKDVDGFSSVNVGKLIQGMNTLTACTPLGIMRLLKEYNIETSRETCSSDR